MTLARNLPPFAALDSATFNSRIWPIVALNRQFFPKGSLMMSEGSASTGVWIITHGCAARSIAAAATDETKQHVVVETLVPGQSVGWEEVTLQMRPEFTRQVLILPHTFMNQVPCSRPRCRRLLPTFPASRLSATCTRYLFQKRKLRTRVRARRFYSPKCCLRSLCSLQLLSCQSLFASFLFASQSPR